jgi:hypothetical protein
MILSAHQPAYMPWLGYFDKIARADVFVYLDTVQFETNSYINRNRIKTPAGAQWITIPVRTRGHTSTTLRQTAVDATQPWRTKHLKTIRMNYSRAPFFSARYPRLEELLSTDETHLAELCWRQLNFWLRELAIETRIVRASELPISGAKSDLALDLCRHFRASHYLSGALGRDYLVEEDFRAAGIDVEYQQYACQVYRQLWGEFVPQLSVLDFWMNCGPDTRLPTG